MSKYPSIPEPQKNVDSLHETVKSLKQVVDMLTGSAGSSGSAQITVNDSQPKNPKTGDLWIRPSGAVTHFWDGTAWRALP